MSYNLINQYGNTEAVIDDNCGISKFYNIANTLVSDLKIKFMNQVDESENLDWDFKFKGNLLTLHYSMYNGVSIMPQMLRGNYNKQNNAVLEVASFLHKRVY
jgi:hypothetical protein